MKKTSILLITAMSCSLAFLSCGFNNLQVPKEVKVRTDATYEFSILNFDSTQEGSKFNVSKYFDLGKILEEKTSGAAGSTGLEIFKYNNGSQFQQFMIHMPLKEIDFDFSESFGNMDFSTATQSFDIPETEIPIPDIASMGLDRDPQELNLDSIENTINTGVTTFGAISPNKQVLNFPTVPGKFSFTSISYVSGKLKIEISGDGDVNSGIFIVYDQSSGSEVEVARSGTITNNIAYIDLADIIVKPDNLKLQYEGDNENLGKAYIIKVDSSSKINTATGITIDSSQPEYSYSVNDVSVSFPINLPSDVKQVEIADGDLNVAIPKPTGWSDGVIGDYTITLSGAIDPSVTINQSASTTGNLNGKQLKNADLVATAHVPVVLNDATIVFTNKPTVQISTEIRELTAEVVMSDSFKLTIDEETDPGEIKNYISSINWNDNGAGFKVTATSTLPDGNDINLTLGSPELQVPSTTQTIHAGTTDPQILNYLCGTGKSTTFADDTKIHVTGSIGVTEGPHSTDEQKTILVTNVTPGETYKIAISVEPVFDWASAEVKMPENFSNINDKMNTSINKKSLFEKLGDDFAEKINITSMPLYLYATLPGTLLGSSGFEGKIFSYYGDESGNAVEGSTNVYLLGNSASYGAITPNAKPEFTKNENNEVTNDFGTPTIDFASAMNSSAPSGTLYLNYDVKLAGSSGGTTTITPEQIETLKTQGKTKIKMDIVMLLSLDFTVTDTIDIDILEIAKKKDGDLLGRSEATDTSAYAKYLEVVKSASIAVEDFNLPVSGNIGLVVKATDNSEASSQTLGNGETFALEVNPLEIIQAYPFKPDIKFQLKQGNFGILRTMPISGKIKLTVTAKGDIPVYPFSEQN